MSFNAAGILRKRLQDLLDEKTRVASKDSRKAVGYECPNWAYKQADAVGYQREIGRAHV